MATVKTTVPPTSRPARTGFIAESGIGRAIAVGAILVVAIALQSTLLTRLTFLGVIPQLIVVVVVSLGWSDGERVGAVAGFAGGLLQDLLLLPQSVDGLYALVYTLVGFGVGYFRQFSPSDSVWMPVFATAVASAVAEFGYALLSILLGQRWIGLGFTAKLAGLVVLYNTLLSPFIYPLVNRIAARFRPDKVYRL